MIKYSLLISFFLCGYLFPQAGDSISFYEMKSHSRLLKAEQINYPGDSTIDVKYYKLNLSIDYDNKLLTGEVLVRFQIPSTGNFNSFFLDLQDNMHVDSVKKGNTRLNYNHSGDKLTITTAGSSPQSGQYDVTIYYHGNPIQDDFGAFVFATSNSGSPVVWSLSEPYGARNWWPCKDALTDKADSAEIWITSSPSFTSVSNGNLIQVSDNPNGTRTYKWKVNYPIAHYLISITLADYVLQTDYFHYSVSDSMPVTNYVWRDTYNDFVKEQLKRTIPALEVYSELFGPYPWLDEKYGHAQCGFGGGMEHQTIASMGGFSENLILHELAHQWFGDKITCETWQDIWLNEGFATYSVALFKEKMYGKGDHDAYMEFELQQARFADGPIYVRNIDNYWEIFNSQRTYSKGAVVLHMLRGVVGDSAFFRILKEYASDPEVSYSTATTQDFQRVAESVSGIDLDYFFNEWIYGENYPQYTVRWGYQHQNDSIYTVNLKIDQKLNTNPLYFTMPVQIRVRTSKGDTLVTFFNNQQSQTFSINVTGQPELVEFDPNNLILKTYSILADSTVEQIIRSFRLSQNYPNPFNPSTKIDFSIPGDGINREFNVVLRIYDVPGNLIAVVLNSSMPPGEYTFTFEPRKYGISSGVYFYNLNVRNPEKTLMFNNTGKMIYLR